MASSAVLIEAAGAPREKDVLARAGQRVLRYQEELPHLIAIETMTQHAIPPRLDSLSEVSDRRLVAEFGWIGEGDQPDLLGVRDVLEVDGRKLEGERAHLQDLLHGGSVTTAEQATRLLNEAARYNLGEGSRNFNLPTVVLFFLHPQRQPRFKWSLVSPKSAPLWVFEFKERDRPTIIRAGDGTAAFSRGEVLVDPQTGVVLRTVLRLQLDRLEYTLTTTFAEVETLRLVLPVRLEERYKTPEGVIAGEATYDNYRRFETGARLLQ